MLVFDTVCLMDLLTFTLFLIQHLSGFQPVCTKFVPWYDADSQVVLPLGGLFTSFLSYVIVYSLVYVLDIVCVYLTNLYLNVCCKVLFCKVGTGHTWSLLSFSWVWKLKCWYHQWSILSTLRTKAGNIKDTVISLCRHRLGICAVSAMHCYTG